MNILLTGNNGYIGTVLMDTLLKKGYSVTGLDVNYFESCSLEPINQKLKQIVKDIRTVDIDDVVGFDSEVIETNGLPFTKRFTPLGAELDAVIVCWGTPHVEFGAR